MKKEKKITYLDLLKLIEEGKQPEKIRLCGVVFYWEEGRYVYRNEHPGAALLIDEISEAYTEVEVGKAGVIAIMVK